MEDHLPRLLLLVGRRDLNSTAPMRGCCFIGTYVREVTALVGIGSHGTANITANMFREYDVRSRAW